MVEALTSTILSLCRRTIFIIVLALLLLEFIIIIIMGFSVENLLFRENQDWLIIFIGCRSSTKSFLCLL